MTQLIKPEYSMQRSGLYTRLVGDPALDVQRGWLASKARGVLRRLPRLTPLLIALFGAPFSPVAALAAPGLDAYVLTAGGNSLFGATGDPFSCATFAPDRRAAIFGGALQVSLPTDGGICGVASDSRLVSASAGPVQTAATLAAGFGSSGDPRSFTGNAQARAGYGTLGVRAVSSYTGASDSATVAGSQAGARQIETMTFGGSSGNGTYRPTFTIDGSLFNVGRTESEVEFRYAIGTGPMLVAFRIMNTASSGISLYANGAYQSALPGIAITGDAVNGFTVAGTTTFSIDIPIQFGSVQEMSFSMWAATIPRSNVGLVTPSGGDASFLNSATLTGIEVFDSGGNALDAFTISSGSGTSYGPGGVIAVPEPRTALMLCLGLLCLPWLRRLRQGL